MSGDDRRSAVHGFEPHAHAWLASLASANTRAAYARDLEVFAGWMHHHRRSPLEATPADIALFRLHCEASGSGSATVNRRLSSLSSFFRHVAAQGGADNPVDGAARAAPPDASAPLRLDRDEAARVWAAAIALGHKAAALVGLVLLDGLKTNELLPLDVEHVRIGRARTVVDVRRRAGVDALTVDPRTAGHLAAYVGTRRGGPLFVGETPTREPARLTRFGVDYLIKRAGARAGLDEPLTVNALRRTRRD